MSDQQREVQEEKYNLFGSEQYLLCQQDKAVWEEEHTGYYKDIICCKPLANKPSETTLNAFSKISQFCTNSYEEVVAKQESKLCVLPKGHPGKCCKNPHMKMFTSGGLSNKFDTGIYSTPGNDGIIFKNRHDRLFPIAIPDNVERKIRDSNTKLSCAIPLKDASCPLMLASAYIDYLVFVVNVRDISTIKAEHSYWDMYADVLKIHTETLKKYFEEKNRRQFNDEGFTVCSATGYEFKVTDFIRDSRVANQETDTQLGHCLSRKDTRYTIRGFNISLMTREGNRLVGDYDFFDETWVNRLRAVVSRFVR